MHINKILLMAALGQAMAHASDETPKRSSSANDDQPSGEGAPIKWVKGTPPNPARLTKAQKKAAKRERRTKAAT